MKDFFEFSLADFLAYMFPGTLMILAIALLLRMSPFKQLVYQIPHNLVTGVILLSVAYCLGVAISSTMANFEGQLLKYFRLSDPIEVIPLKEFDNEVNNAFAQTFGDHRVWSREHFYLARTLVCEKLPRCAATIERQASLRQIRRNMVMPVLFLGIEGTIAGLKILLSNVGQARWGACMIALSLAGSYVVAAALVKNGMHANRTREMRDVCSGLLVYYHSSASSPAEKTNPEEADRA
jgi:hypothetical protein